MGERRYNGLKLAASMLKPRSQTDRPPTAKELIEYAEELAEYMYEGKRAMKPTGGEDA